MNRLSRETIALMFVPGFGPRKIMKLLKENKYSEEMFPEKEREVKRSDEYFKELAYIEKQDIKVICYDDDHYPENLKNIYDPPPLIFCKGEFKKSDANTVAIVGSRRCSLYGLQMAEKLGFELAERGITVISGMARGIDTAAHRGALKAGGRTIAVMGSGFRHIYPPEGKKLFNQIAERGAVITEHTSDISPRRENFPRRNRIISGLAKGVIVVEASRKSGALITVDYALEQGREVFSVPGKANAVTSEGTNDLIRKGAKLVTNIDDVLEELDMEIHGPDQKETSHKWQDLTQEEETVLRMLDGKESVHIDSIIEQAGIDASGVHKILLSLELKGIAESVPGKYYKVAKSSVR